jgi:allene oxide cyclase
MKSFRLMLMGLVLTLLVLALAAFSARQESGSKMTVVEHADTDAVTDTGDEGDSAGDILTFANKVYDEQNATEIGSDNGYCFRTVVGEAWECHWTLTLEKGQITVDGPFLDKGDSVMAITGGTGDYATASGQMTLHARNDQGTEYDFGYELAG